MPDDYDISLYEERQYSFGCTLDPIRDAEAVENPFKDWPTLIAMVGKIVSKTRAGSNSLAAARAMV